MLAEFQKFAGTRYRSWVPAFVIPLAIIDRAQVESRAHTHVLGAYRREPATANCVRWAHVRDPQACVTREALAGAAISRALEEYGRKEERQMVQACREA